MRGQYYFVNAELVHQIFRFGIVGFSNVIVDLAVYSTLMIIGADIISSKALAFVAGTLFSFIVNRRWTFKSQHTWSSRIVPFFLLYTLSMLVNVSINYLIVDLSHYSQFGYAAAYGSATTVSSVINFLGMRSLFQCRADK